MKALKRISVVCVAIIFLIALLPVSAFAIDPVSAATMANALAQAITAYGASQGVSMTFDVANTDGIGEGVHDLWDQFKADINDNNVPTYDSFAVTVWSTLFSKVNNNVAINLSDTSVSYLDAFWNWLLSGPAEMTKVDDQYYEWSLNQSNTVDPIRVLGIGLFYNQPLPYDSYINANEYRKQLFIGTGSVNNVSCDVYCYTDQSNSIYVFQVASDTYFVVKGTSSRASYYMIDSTDTILSNTTVQIYSGSPWRSGYVSNLLTGYDLPVFQSYSDAITELNNSLSGNGTVVSSVSVQPYIGDATPQDVYIPDNEDVNYQPLPYIGELDIPWSDSLYGDGVGSLSDAQTEAITSDLSSTIERDSTLTLAQDVPIVNPPSEVYIPLLPVTLPSFNFSFSGIWHYVVTWVGTLGSWLSLMFTVWQSLPYAIVVPVYATAVIVIVIGTLKRFL